MASKLIKMGSIQQLAPGATKPLHWNKASPPNAVWYVQAVPLESSIVPSPAEQSVSVEVTRVWRKLIIKEPIVGEIPVKSVEHEVHYEVKNIGAKPVNVDIYASIIS